MECYQVFIERWPGGWLVSVNEQGVLPDPSLMKIISTDLGTAMVEVADRIMKRNAERG